jgi:hypothetical protein
MTIFISRSLAAAALLICVWATSARAQSCATDSDCVSPLTCKQGAQVCSGGGGILPDGGTYVTATVCENQPSKCTWTFVRCQAESECTQTNWACLSVPDQDTIKTCFPRAISCSGAQSCPTEWSCIDFTQVYDSDPLQIWSATGNNYCWPDSLNGVLYREIRTDSSGLGLSGISGGVDKGSTDAGQASTLGGDESQTSVDAGTTGSSGTGSAPANSTSGCTIGDRNTFASWTLLALALVGLLRLRHMARKS